ncbi:MAG: hypothetical protein IJP80_03955 [Bacteroidales bacterium]|nr:hypothetical protein [Bacteroidales bacterium]
MKKTSILAIATGALLMVSCFSSRGLLGTQYDVRLASVESPANAKQQFGDTKIVKSSDNDVDKYRYEDDYIVIVWYVTSKEFHFQLTNKSSHSIKLNWDDMSYVSVGGQVQRVMHSGVKYMEKNNSQPATTVPRGATISDLLLPTDNVYYVSGQYGGWRTRKLVRSDEAVGKTMTILMPIVIENVQNDYTFVFSVDKPAAATQQQ